MRAKLAELEKLRVKLYGQEAVDKYNAEHKGIEAKEKAIKLTGARLEKTIAEQNSIMKKLKIFYNVCIIPPIAFIYFYFARKAYKLCQLTKHDVKEVKKHRNTSIFAMIGNVMIVAMFIYFFAFRGLSVGWFR